MFGVILVRHFLAQPNEVVGCGFYAGHGVRIYKRKTRKIMELQSDILSQAMNE